MRAGARLQAPVVECHRRFPNGFVFRDTILPEKIVGHWQEVFGFV
jgi:hypothetical protein